MLVIILLQIFMANQARTPWHFRLGAISSKTLWTSYFVLLLLGLNIFEMIVLFLRIPRLSLCVVIFNHFSIAQFAGLFSAAFLHQVSFTDGTAFYSPRCRAHISEKCGTMRVQFGIGGFLFTTLFKRSNCILVNCSIEAPIVLNWIINVFMHRP